MKTLFGIIALVVLVSVMASKGENKPTPAVETHEQIAAKAEAKRQEAEAKAAEAARCRADQSCWGNKNMFAGLFECREQIERSAKYDFKWTDGWLDTKFTHFRWRDWNKQIITLSGDKLQLQNGFGGWVRHTYDCDVDVSRVVPSGENLKDARVLTVRVTPGRIP
jgi:hypothetical protein